MIEELEKKLKEIDQTLFIDKSLDEPILSIKTVDENLIIYDFERKLFFRDGLQVFWDRNCNDTDNDFCALQRLIADYQGEMKAQDYMSLAKFQNLLRKLNKHYELMIYQDYDPRCISYVDNDRATTIYDFDSNYFNFNGAVGVLSATELNNLMNLIFKFKTRSKESQKISNDSKNKNGSTAAFSKFASKDSQKKSKAQLIYDFIDEIADHGFDTEQTVINHKTNYIKVSYKFDDPIRVDCLEIYLSDLGIDKIPDNPIYLNKDLCMQLDEQKLMKLNWLFERVSKFVSGLRGEESEN